MFGFGSTKKVFRDLWLEKRKFDPNLLDIKDYEEPICLKYMDDQALLKKLREIKDTYKSLGYRFKKENDLKFSNEYNGYELSLLLTSLYRNFDLKIDNFNNYWGEDILKHERYFVQNKVNEILHLVKDRKYVEKSEKQLKDDITWTPIDIAYILLYLTFEKD
jgi:hypothetical protein